jgi:hypothetical protein
VGALLLVCRHIICALVFGAPYWELTPWCDLVPVQWEYNGHLSGGVTIKQAFDSFSVDQVQLPTDLETKRHVYISTFLDLRTTAELKSVSGKEIYLLRILPVVTDSFGS